MHAILSKHIHLINLTVGGFLKQRSTQTANKSSTSPRIMAPRNKSFPIALLVAAFAVSLQSSTAIRIPPLIPCIPGLPKIPFIPCYEVEPSPPPPPLKTPSECRTPLMKLMPCAGYLTNASVSKPPSACCKGFDSICNSGEAICFCHVGNGDIGQLLPAPLNIARIFRLTADCGIDLRLEPYAECNSKSYTLIRSTC